MEEKREKKAFLLYKKAVGGICPHCIVLAKTIEEAAKAIGGRVDEIRIRGKDPEKIVILPKELFTPTKKGDDYFYAGELLEFELEGSYLTIFPEDEGAELHFMIIPFLHADSASGN